MLYSLVALFACQSPDGGDSGDAPAPKTDADGDGYLSKVDCDDEDPSVHPDQDDPCNDVDDDCDGEIDEDLDLSWYPDADGDGWGDAGATETAACAAPAGHVANHRDCDDTSAAVWPGQAEACDGLDNDCDGSVDEGLGDTVTVYPDEDGDGAGDMNAEPITTCAEMAEGVDNAEDCDDRDAGEPVYTDPDGRRAAAGTREDPLASISDAIDAASTCIRVYPGTYYDNLLPGGKSLDIRSLGSSADTFVYSATGESVFEMFSGEDVTLVGFTLSGGSGRQSFSSYYDGSDNLYYAYTSYGGAVYVYGADLTLEDVVVSYSYVYSSSYSSYYDSTTGSYIYYTYEGYGGGIYAVSSLLRLTDVSVDGNSGGTGGGIYTEGSDVVALRLAVRGNTGTSFPGLYATGGDIELTNLVVNSNEDNSGYGAVSCNGCTLSVQNGTFVDNTTAVLFYNSAFIDLDSSTIQGGTYGIYSYGGTLDARYTNFYNLTAANIEGDTDISGINGNTSVSSAFLDFNNDGDAFNDDLHLGSSSALIDAGNPDASVNDSNGTRNDAGAYGGPEGASW